MQHLFQVENEGGSIQLWHAVVCQNDLVHGGDAGDDEIDPLPHLLESLMAADAAITRHVVRF